MNEAVCPAKGAALCGARRFWLYQYPQVLLYVRRELQQFAADFGPCVAAYPSSRSSRTSSKCVWDSLALGVYAHIHTKRIGGSNQMAGVCRGPERV